MITTNDKDAGGVGVWTGAVSPSALGQTKDAAGQSGEAPAESPGVAKMPWYQRIAKMGAGVAGQQGGTGNGNQGTTTTTATTTTLATKVPDVFKARYYDELIPEIQRRMKDYEPESEEQKAKRLKREKAEGIMAGISDAARSVANLIATHHYAPNMYDPTTTMSAKTKARYDKEKAERDANDDRYLNYATMLAKMRGAEDDRAFKIWQLEQQLDLQNRQYNDSRADRAADVAFRDQQYKDSRKDRQDDVDYREKEFNEGVRQFDKALAAGRYSHGGGGGRGGGGGSGSDGIKGYTYFGSVPVSNSIINDDAFLAQYWKNITDSYLQYAQQGGAYSPELYKRLQHARDKESRRQAIQIAYSDYADDPNKNNEWLAMALMSVGKNLPSSKK